MAVFIESADCQTVFGDRQQTVQSLLNGKCGLEPTPVLGTEGGDRVPMALRADMTTPIPPRWWNDLLQLLSSIPEFPWGSSRFPILFSSSNFGIDSMYALIRERTRNEHCLWATAGNCIQHLREKKGWKQNITTFSHACVSAHLAMVHADALLKQNLAEKVLIVSFDYLGAFVTGGFHALKILNEGFPAPYEDGPTGSIGLGDGAAWAVLSREAGPWKMAAASTWNEMYHFTANDPSGSGFESVLDPLLPPLQGRSFWLKGHGTGTLDAGRLESTILQRYFPSAPLVSWKGSLGHTLGSCALVEAILAITAHDSGSIPGTIGTTGPTFSSTVAKEAFSCAEFDSILLLANAFGGAHGALCLTHD